MAHTTSSVGFCLAYSHGPVAHLTHQLASYARQLGLDVSIRSTSQVTGPVNGDCWDRHVESPARRPLADWFADKDYVLWFDVQRAITSRKLRERDLPVRHALYLPLHDLPDGEHRQISQDYPALVCGTPTASIMAAERFGTVRNNIHFVPACPRLPTLKIQPPTSGNRLLCLADSQVMKRQGGSLLIALSTSLTANPDLQISLLHSTKPTQAVASSLQRLSSRHASRFRSVLRPDYARRIAELVEADWVLLPSVRDHVGLYGLEALAYRRPVLTFAVEPWSSLLPVRGESWQLPYLPGDAATTYRGLADRIVALSQSAAVPDAARSDWSGTLHRFREAFEDYWAKEWGLLPLLRKD